MSLSPEKRLLIAHVLIMTTLLYPDCAEAAGVKWIRSRMDSDRPEWGIRGSLKWGLPRPSGRGGCRGLILLRYPTLRHGDYDLINFIAIEPVVNGSKGFSELEQSQLDDKRGKRLWARDADDVGSSDGGWGSRRRIGKITKLKTGVQCLTVHVGVERFLNGAHVRLTAIQRSDAPDEIEWIVHAEPDSAPIEYCILTATMGNKARARKLWLKDKTASSLDLYSDYKGDGFAPHRYFPLDQLMRTGSGEVVVSITTDEADPGSVKRFKAARYWQYHGFPVTQFWKKPAGAWRKDLHVAVNGRYTYWRSRRPIPGGVAFENFEMRERFYDGQRFVFGISKIPHPGRKGK